MYALITNETLTKYPYSQYELKQDNPSISFPQTLNDELLAEHGVYVVSEIYPATTETQVIVFATVPELVNGVWTLTHTLRDKTVEELAEADAELAASRAAMVVTMRQARLQLLALGSLAVINAAIATMPEEAQVEWEYATEVQRTNPLLTALVQLLGWSEADTDLYFTEAAKL